MENYTKIGREDGQIILPPGFRFHPTDAELITFYLCPKVLNPRFQALAIGEADLNKVEPWDLPRIAKMGEKEWYFFCVRDRKYPTGMRTNRATEAGYWKATGKDKEISESKTLVGMKKTLVFYTGRAPKGEKTNWVMHEYRLEGQYSKPYLPQTAQNEWVISRIFDKTPGPKTPNDPPSSGNVDEMHPQFLPPLMDSFSPLYDIEPKMVPVDPPHVTCFSSQDLANENPIIDLTGIPELEDRAPVNPLVDEHPADFDFMDLAFIEDQSILKLLLEETGESYAKATTQIQTCYCSSRQQQHQHQHQPQNQNQNQHQHQHQHQQLKSFLVMYENSDGPIDLDSLWGY